MSNFPQPDLQISPQTVEEMLAMEQAQQPNSDASVAPSPESQPPVSEDTPSDSPAPGGSLPNEAATRPDDGQPPAPAAEVTPNKAAAPPAEPASETPAETDTPQPDGEKPATETQTGAGEENEVEAKPSEGELNDCGPQEAAVGVTAEVAAEQAASPPDTENQIATDSQVAAPADAGADGAEKSPPKVETKEELQERLEALQEQIARDNQRKLDERKEKIDAATKKVQELNARFAEWYYVVSDSVYKKLTLSRDTLITTAPATPGPAGLPGAPSGLPPGFQLPGNP